MRSAGPLLSTLLSLGIVLTGWTLFLDVLSISPLIGKSPLAVWHYLFLTSISAHNRAALLAALGVTLVHAGIGFASGTVLGLVVAFAFVLQPAVQNSLMPLMMILRTMPLVALTPLIVLLFGRGLLAIGVIGALSVFFPTVVMVTLGLRAAPRASADLIRVHGGGRWMALRKVGFPTAIPAMFTAARMSVPSALVGALLAEWLASGDGLGNRMQRDISGFRSSDLWSGIVVLTLCSLLLYGLLGLLEQRVSIRYGRGAKQ